MFAFADNSDPSNNPNPRTAGNQPHASQIKSGSGDNSIGLVVGTAGVSGMSLHSAGGGAICKEGTDRVKQQQQLVELMQTLHMENHSLDGI